MKRTKFLIFVGLFISFVSFSNAQSQNSDWAYIQLDDQNSKWGDYSEPDWLRYFGLDMGDLNGDGYKDVLTGRSIYLNPQKKMDKVWEKIDLGLNVDGILIIDVDGDKYADVIAQALPNVYWFEAKNKDGTEWEAKVIGQIPATSHTNSQGFTKAQMVAGGKDEFLIAGNGNIYLFEIPDNPRSSDWKITLVAANTSDEGIGTGDIDGDGDLDIAAGRRPEGEGEPLIVVWYDNPGDDSAMWPDHEIGKTNHPADRFAVADFNGDDKADILVCEERWPGEEPDGNIFWYQQGDDRSEQWKRNHITTQYSSNNLQVVDMDNDGDHDFITSEHKGKKLSLQYWENDGQGTFSKHILDTGKESHLGTQVADMDGDGDLDIVSIGWDQHKYVHLWRNDKQ